MFLRSAVLGLMACAVAAVGPSIARAEGPVRIGFVAELSGPQGGIGQDQYDGFMLLVERNGGKLGGVPVEVLK